MHDGLKCVRCRPVDADYYTGVTIDHSAAKVIGNNNGFSHKLVILNLNRANTCAKAIFIVPNGY